MKTEKEIKDEIKRARKLRHKNPDFWDGYKQGLQWTLKQFIRIDGCELHVRGCYIDGVKK